MAKAPHTHGSVSLLSLVTASARELTPIRRRSTIAIMPSTVTSAITCSVSMVGNIHVDSAIVTPRLEYSIDSQMLVGSGYSDDIETPLDRCVGDEPPAIHDHHPQDDEEHRRSLVRGDD